MRSSAALPAALLLLTFHTTAGGQGKPEEKEYVGSEVCQTCHEDLYRAFVRSPHQQVETAKKFGRTGQACESCHGPASKHVETTSPADIVNPAKLRAGPTDQTCLTCHLNQPGRVGRIQSGHSKAQVGCPGCHTIHSPAGMSRVKKPAEINAQCSSCHVSTMAEFRKPYAHRLQQRAMSCTDCHNPHGEFRSQVTRLSAANEPGCLRCHADKRGPFAFEHAPMRLEGCSVCHETHGSANPRMLTRHEVSFVCLECHANTGVPQQGRTVTLGTVPPSFHDLRSARYRNCTICHQKIHGSHVDRNFLR